MLGSASMKVLIKAGPLSLCYLIWDQGTRRQQYLTPSIVTLGVTFVIHSTPQVSTRVVTSASARSAIRNVACPCLAVLTTTLLPLLLLLILLALLPALSPHDPTLAAGIAGVLAAAAAAVAQDLTSPWPAPAPVSPTELAVKVVRCDRHWQVWLLLLTTHSGPPAHHYICRAGCGGIGRQHDCCLGLRLSTYAWLLSLIIDWRVLCRDGVSGPTFPF